VELISEAIGIGFRTAVCAPHPVVVERLQELSDAAGASYVASRDAALAALG
jgi:hypothetical protein